MTSRDSGPPPSGGGRSQGPGVVAQPAEAVSQSVGSVSGGAAPSSPQPVVSPQIARVLGAAPLFKSFTDTGLQILGSIAQEKSVPPGTPIFVENMIGDGLYVVAEGLIRISIRGPRGYDMPLTVLGPHETLGEAAVLRSGPRLCSATAEVQSTVIEISRRDIAALQRTKPQACLKLMMCVVDLIGVKMGDAGGELRRYIAWRSSGVG